jgi:hypothetical protein
MIVPQYWAEARVLQKRGKGRGQVTVRRFGWSNTSQAEAEVMAQRRANEALQRITSDTPKLLRFEPKRPYNGAEGVPIREEILSRHGDTVITRNSYGAHCLNTPDVLFADIDFKRELGVGTILLHGLFLILVAAILAVFHRSGLGIFISALLVLILAYPFAILTRKILENLGGGPEKIARRRVAAFAKTHSDWHLRLYRTPAGLRVLVLHQPFAPSDPAVKGFFDKLGVDPVYAAMCRNQQCFRARVSPKPWRVGVSEHMRPRPGTWPISPDRSEQRQAWVRVYEAAAATYASCRFVENLGSGTTHAKTEAVCTLHDNLSRALSGREIA